MKLESLKEFLFSVDYPVLIAISDCEAWCIEDERYIKWVSLDKDNELNAYSCYLPEGYHRQSGYFIANLDTQTGTWQTELFDEGKEMSEDDFYDKYEEHF